MGPFDQPDSDWAQPEEFPRGICPRCKIEDELPYRVCASCADDLGAELAATWEPEPKEEKQPVSWPETEAWERGLP